MTAGFPSNSDPVAAFTKRIADLEQAVRDLSRPQPFIIPTPGVDLPETAAGNIWLLPDGRIRARVRNPGDTAWVYFQWGTVAPGSGTSGTAPAPPKPAKKSYRYESNATWSKGYRQNGTKRTDYPTWGHYGYVDSFNGLGRTVIGFNYAAIQAAITGGTINRVRLKMQNLHSYWNAGSDIFFSIHNLTAEPATYIAGGGNTPSRRLTKHRFRGGEIKVVDLSKTFGTAIRDGWGRGIVLDPTSTSKEQYGYIAGVGSGYQVPRLIIDYVK